MALSGSPTNYGNGYEEDPIFQKSHYTQDISEQMRVPKRIKATGEYYDDFDMPLGNGGGSNHWNYHDKIDMTVPDRIMVIGQEQHLGAFICVQPQSENSVSGNSVALISYCDTHRHHLRHWCVCHVSCARRSFHSIRQLCVGSLDYKIK